MNKNVFPILLITIGGYLLIGNTIFSMLFNYAGPIGYDVLMSLGEYWVNWLINYGLITILIAVLGIVLILFGISIPKRRKIQS